MTAVTLQGYHHNKEQKNKAVEHVFGAYIKGKNHSDVRLAFVNFERYIELMMSHDWFAQPTMENGQDKENVRLIKIYRDALDPDHFLFSQFFPSSTLAFQF